MAMTMPPGSVRDSLAHPAASSTSPMADGKIQTPFSEITSPGGLKCQEFGGRRGFEERQVPEKGCGPRVRPRPETGSTRAFGGFGDPNAARLVLDADGCLAKSTRRNPSRSAAARVGRAPAASGATPGKIYGSLARTANAALEWAGAWNDVIDGVCLRVRLETLCLITMPCETPCEESDVCDEDPCLGRGDCFLPVLCKPAASIEPGKGSLDHPSSGQDFKALGGVGSPDDFERPGADVFQGGLEFRSS